MKTGADLIRRLGRDDRGQAMTEYVILSAVMIAIAAYLYLPDNNIYQGIRLKHDRTMIAIAHPGP